MIRLLSAIFLMAAVYLRCFSCWADTSDWMFKPVAFTGIGAEHRHDGFYHLAILDLRKYLKQLEVNSQYVLPYQVLNDIGVTNHEWKRYGDAQKAYKEALLEAIATNSVEDAIIITTNQAYLAADTGRLDVAESLFRDALKKARSVENAESELSSLRNLGLIEAQWGQFEAAMRTYGQSLAIAKSNDLKGQVTYSMLAIADVQEKLGKTDEAVKIYLELEKTQNAGVEEKQVAATISRSLGDLYFITGDLGGAETKYRQALAIDYQRQDKRSAIHGIKGLGLVQYRKQDFNGALGYFKRALLSAREHSLTLAIAELQDYVGLCYLAQEKYTEAVASFNEAISLKEELRKTATGIARIDYLASQIHSYRWLIFTHTKAGDAVGALEVIEFSSAKYLREQIERDTEAKKHVELDVDSIRHKIDPSTAIFHFANTEMENSSRIITTQKGIVSAEIKKTKFLGDVQTLLDVSLPYKNGAGFSPHGDNGLLSYAVSTYRELLSKPNQTDAEKKISQGLARAIYNLLFEGADEQLRQSQQLIIVPEGVLAFLPFETLVTPDGDYLIERYHIRYVRSLAISQAVENRTYPSDRKGVLAIGGANYKNDKSAAPNSSKEALNSQRRALLSMNRGSNTGYAYSKIGLNKWSNLPGTKEEVQKIARLVPESRFLVGAEASEDMIHHLSETGELKEYTVIHFATHAFAMPEIPELSALVLSNPRSAAPKTDGYLSMQEIANLKMEADFVNLSACETGLGKIYGGEGVSGLAQSFLIAGANSLSVSLWQVSDESTKDFMLGVYELVQQQDMTYDEAMTEMKRRFISNGKSAAKSTSRGLVLDGVQNSHRSLPFYWAPFVHYGHLGSQRGADYDRTSKTKFGKTRPRNSACTVSSAGKTNPEAGVFGLLMMMLESSPLLR